MWKRFFTFSGFFAVGFGITVVMDPESWRQPVLVYGLLVLAFAVNELCEWAANRAERREAA